jgi:hypothetical protein
MPSGGRGYQPCARQRRRAWSVQVAVETLRRGERTGTVAPDALAPVRRRLEELAGGSSDPEPEDELDDWLDEVLQPARAALGTSSLEAPGTPRRFGRPAMAAGLLLLVALGSASALAWRFHQRERLSLGRIERLVHERRELETRHQRQLEALRQVQARPAPAATRAAPEPPPPVREPLRPLINLAYVSFYPGETRGAQREIAVPGGSTHLFLLFFVGDQKSCQEYGLEIVRRGAPAASLDMRGLRPLSGQEVSLAVPREQLPDGSYRFRLYGLCGGERRELGAYEARLKENAR